MRKLFLLFILSCFAASTQAQKSAARLESVLKSGSSARAFEFVRDYFNLSARQDPFLHFKERGIKQLVSFCDYRARRIEATSLIKFAQVKQFWKNYSEQFTGGKWNYKSLYPTDSLAWIAANYSITLIYVHEVGHYMSLRFTQNTTETYTCEEYLANECLAAFANSFNDNQKLEEHKKLFLELAKQTARSIPDSNKTSFDTPVKNWCGADPMKVYMHLYGNNDKEFLRFYGYTQFRMMEYTLINYPGEGFQDFLERKFYRQFTRSTGKLSLKPLKYTVISSAEIKAKGIFCPWLDVTSTGVDSSRYFSYRNFDASVVFINKQNEIFNCYPYRETIHNTDSSDERLLSSSYIISQKRQADSTRIIESWIYADSVYEARPVLLSAWENKGNFYYLIKRIAWGDSTAIAKYEYYNLFSKEGKRYSKRFFLPDSLTQTSSLHDEYLLAGTNMGFPVIIHNQLTNDYRQAVSMYIIDTTENTLGVKLWNSITKEKGFFNMYAPAVYVDTKNEKINIAFINPVSESIGLISIGNTSSESFELYNPVSSTYYPQQMKFRSLNFISANQLLVLAGLPGIADHEKTSVKKLLIKW